MAHGKFHETLKLQQQRESRVLGKALWRAVHPYADTEQDAKAVTGRGRVGNPHDNGKRR